MVRAATSRLKFNPPLGRMPVLQFVPPAELAIDESYQRSLADSASQSLIRKIAVHWNWDLCQPLVVSQRDDRLFVIDGQHRLAAARARGDIAQLPCVVVKYSTAADEAASFVHLNQQRRPLSKLDVFKAAVASEDPEALAIMAALEGAGLSVAPHSNFTAWKPGMVSNIGGIENAWRKHGALAASEALECLSAAFSGEVLRYAGTIYPGIAAVCAEEVRGRSEFEPGRFASFTAKLGARGQDRLREDIMLEQASDTSLSIRTAAERIVCELWWPERKKAREVRARERQAQETVINFKADEHGMAWCDQCDMRVNRDQAEGCKSRWCSLKVAPASGSAAVGRQDIAA